MQGESGGEIEGYGYHQRKNDRCAGKIEIVDHRVGEQAPSDTFDG